MSGRISRLCLALCAALLLLNAASKASRAAPVVAKKVGVLALLVPDTAVSTDPRITIWMDALAEEGLQAAIIHDADFLQPTFDATQYAGIIMPDQVHANASDALIAALTQYVTLGGKFMLVFDAGSFTPTGFYSVPKSRFSQLAGIDYILYDALRDKTIGFGPIAGTELTMCALRVPPGKFMPYDGVFTDSPSPVDAPQGKPCVIPGFSSNFYTPTGYVYGTLGFPGYVTQGAYAGTPLLTSPSFGLAAGYNPVGKGACLFVNIPLGYMKQQTDGVYLHGFLHYFATDLLHLPYLAPVPGGVGGMILNWHLDAEEAQAPLMTLKSLGIFKNNGPFSIHITAGPDTVTPGDGLGFNLPHNPVMQQTLREFANEGHQVGSHGGWIHDWWGFNAPAVLPADPAQQPFWYNLLIWNKQAVEMATGKPMLEYSAPEGNQPEWVTTWLQQQGALGYYFVGNTGMAPTRSYRNGMLLNKKIWSVPVCNYGQYATFEEFEDFHVPTPAVTSWYTAMENFTSQYRQTRLIYMHPPGASDYVPTLQSFLSRAKQLNAAGRFQWYTITQIGQFLNQREQTVWSTSVLPDGTQVFDASHPVSLKSFTWVLPKAAYQKPVISQGAAAVGVDSGHAKPKLKNNGNTTATVSGDTDEWLVTAAGGTSLRFTSKPIAP